MSVPSLPHPLDIDAALLAHDIRTGKRPLFAATNAALERFISENVGPDGLNAILDVDEQYQHGMSGGMYRAGGGADDDTPVTEVELPLVGVPVVIKDNIATLRMATSCGS
ncbi:MAG: hypothetical protein ABI120_16970, partial [Gemmatimonadaceae bacterium]